MSMFDTIFSSAKNLMGNNDNSQSPQTTAGQNQASTPNLGQTPAANSDAAASIAAGANATGEKKPENPLDKFTDLYKIDPTKTQEAPVFKLDPTILAKVAGEQDFTQNIPPELMQKATNGDAASMVQLMKLIGQQAYAAALNHNSTLTDKFVAARSDYDKQSIQPLVNRTLTNNELSNTPNFDHPVVKAQLNQIADAMYKQNPEASPSEIANAAKDYIIQLGKAINGDKNASGSNTSGNGSQGKPMDWSSWVTNSN